MTLNNYFAPLFFCPLLSSLVVAQETAIPTKEQVHKGWVDLLSADKFTATGLTHWRNVNVDKSTFKFSEQKSKDGSPILICSGKPTGLIRTAGVYENFLIEFDWRHMTRDGMRANAGFFVWSDGLPAKGTPFSRSVEVQVANFDKDAAWFTRHGDVFAIHGAKMKVDPRFGKWGRGMRSLPLEFRAKDTGEWNHYRILCIDGTIQLEVNGKVVSGGYHAFPRKGHLMIESEGGEVHFKNMRLLPLPASDRLKPEDEAKTLPATTVITSLYNGIDLKGWHTSKDADIKASDFRLAVKSGRASKIISSKAGGLILDWRSPSNITSLPFSLDEKAAAIDLPNEIKAGGHRAKIELETGNIFIDGKLVTKVHPKTITMLTLRSAGENTIYNNILHLSE